MLFFDFEVFKHDWLVVLLDMSEQRETVIVNDPEQLKQFYNQHKNDVWVGFNSRHYDQYILKGILSGFDPKEINDFIILKGGAGWQYSDLFRRIPLYNYDVMQNIDRGLKVFEGFLGSNICESSVPFDIDRKLSHSELQETIKYCRHDVEQTIEVFLQRKADFDAQMSLLKMFNLPLSDISKTKVQLSAKILGARKREYTDEFDIDFPDTLKIRKYTEVLEWYKNPENRKYHVDPENPKSKKMKLETMIAGVPHIFAWGGVHGARTKYNAQGYFINMDVSSLYPSLMIRYNLHSRSCVPEKFNDIVKTRLKLKHESNPLQAPLKIVINGTYGAMKDKHNPLYDPRQANRVCVYGQLLILDLMERLEEIGAIIIQSNTDGVLVQMPDDFKGGADAFYNVVDDTAFEWETRTGLELEFDEYTRVYQKDVNNYVIISADGHYKTKGAYVKKLSALDYDLPIVNKAVVGFIVDGTPPEQIINACDELKEFQQVKKISNKYDYLFYDDRPLLEKTVRVFASNDRTKGGLKMKHKSKTTLDKVSNTPENCFIFNGNVEGVTVPDELNKQWYIDMAYKRLADFGVC